MRRDLKGCTCMVTGANQGLGFHTAQELAKRGATLHMVCRNPERGQEAVQRVIASSGNSDVHLQVCDVSSLAAVRQLARSFEASQQPLHVLVNNAGVLINEPATSADGYELSFATNTLGGFALTLLLEPVLKRSAPARVIFVSSGGMLTEKLEVDDLQSKKAGKHNGSSLYAKDKRRMVALAERFSERWQGAGVASYAMHPGWTVTEGVKKSIPGFYERFKASMRNLDQGADTIVWLALEDEAKLEGGAFYLDRAAQPKHLPLGGTTYSPEHVDKLWQQLEAMVAASA